MSFIAVYYGFIPDLTLSTYKTRMKLWHTLKIIIIIFIIVIILFDFQRQGFGLGQIASRNLSIPGKLSVSRTFLSIPDVTKFAILCIFFTERLMFSIAMQGASYLELVPNALSTIGTTKH